MCEVLSVLGLLFEFLSLGGARRVCSGGPRWSLSVSTYSESSLVDDDADESQEEEQGVWIIALLSVRSPTV